MTQGNYKPTRIGFEVDYAYQKNGFNRFDVVGAVKRPSILPCAGRSQVGACDCMGCA